MHSHTHWHRDWKTRARTYIKGPRVLYTIRTYIVYMGIACLSVCVLPTHTNTHTQTYAYFVFAAHIKQTAGEAKWNVKCLDVWSVAAAHAAGCRPDDLRQCRCPNNNSNGSLKGRLVEPYVGAFGSATSITAMSAKVENKNTSVCVRKAKQNTYTEREDK